MNAQRVDEHGVAVKNKSESERLPNVPEAAPLWETRPARLRGSAVDRDSRTGRVTYPMLG